MAAGQPSRSGIPTIIITETPVNSTLESLYHLTTQRVARALSTNHHTADESWTTYHDIWDAWTIPADLRAAVAPYLAAHLHRAAARTLTWLLYGDDDTLWVPRGLQRLIHEEGWHHSQPMLVSDALWFPDRNADGTGV